MIERTVYYCADFIIWGNRGRGILQTDEIFDALRGQANARQITGIILYYGECLMPQSCRKKQTVILK